MLFAGLLSYPCFGYGRMLYILHIRYADMSLRRSTDKPLRGGLTARLQYLCFGYGRCCAP